MFFPIFMGFVILQRLGELLLAKRNEKILLEKGGVEFDRSGYNFIVLMHTMFFISLVVEYYLLSRNLSSFWLILFALFVSAQGLRYWAIASLGEYWNTRIIVLEGAPIIKKGPYRFLNHPNYIAVCTELAVIPLIFSCYYTPLIFSILNFFLIRRRIKIEEKALGLQ